MIGLADFLVEISCLFFFFFLRGRMGQQFRLIRRFSDPRSLHPGREKWMREVGLWGLGRQQNLGPFGGLEGLMSEISFHF